MSCHHQQSSLLREGKARVTLFASESNAQTFDFYVRHSNSKCSPTDQNVHNSPETSLTYPLRLVRVFHSLKRNQVTFYLICRPLHREHRQLDIETHRDPQNWYGFHRLLFARHAPEGCLLLDIFQDISLSQWLALTPPELVKAHLGFSDEVIHHLNKVKQVIVR